MRSQGRTSEYEISSQHDAQSPQRWWLGRRFNLSLFGRQFRQVLLVMVMAAGLAVGSAGTASAITPVNCASGPPAPIRLLTNDVNTLCFGGTVGFESVGRFVRAIDAGGYYTRITFTIPGSNTTYNSAFQPGESLTLNVNVTTIEIIPPFSARNLPTLEERMANPQVVGSAPLD